VPLSEVLQLVEKKYEAESGETEESI